MIESYFYKIEKFFGNLKFAVSIILIFTLMMIIGTFIESSSGAEFANRLIYKNWPFILIQSLMFLSIFFAATLRLPPRKKLYGFYIIHSGLIIIGCGSFITYYSGIDGNILLYPNTPNRTVVLNDDQLYLNYPNQNIAGYLDLPYTSFSSNINFRYKDVLVKEYLPYANEVFSWKKTQKRKYSSGKFIIANDNISQGFVLSLHPKASQFDTNLQLGPLSIHYLPDMFVSCLKKINKYGVIILNTKLNKCSLPSDWNADFQSTTKGSRFFVIKNKENQLLSFMPDFSPWPMDSKMNFLKKSHLKTFNPNLFLKNQLSLYWENLSIFIIRT